MKKVKRAKATRAWGIVRENGKLSRVTYRSWKSASLSDEYWPGERIVRVRINEV